MSEISITLLNKIKALGRIPKFAIIATLNLCLLYACILNQEAVNAISEHVRNDPEAEIPLDRMAKLVEMILKAEREQ